MRYLDFMVNENGLKVDEETRNPILEFPRPKNLTITEIDRNGQFV